MTVIERPSTQTAGSPSASPDPSLGGEPTAGEAAREPELLTLPEAAEVTGLSVKALTRRIERGTLPSESKAGRRLVRRGELERLELTWRKIEQIADDGGCREEGGGVVIWRELYDQAAAELAARNAELASVRAGLARIEGALTAAGPFARVRQLRRRLAAATDALRTEPHPTASPQAPLPAPPTPANGAGRLSRPGAA